MRMIEVKLFFEDGDKTKLVQVPSYVLKELLCDRLSKSELNRIHRFADVVPAPEILSAGSAFINFSDRTAKLFQTGINLENLEPTWSVKIEPMTLFNYL